MSLTWPEKFPRVVADLSLDLPALIEASAGTGKTFAIEHLILRMCREKDWNPRDILVLSFTKKTTGELRDRVRECFRRESGKESRFKNEKEELFWTEEERKRFFEACLSCDEAAIHTLHEFCHSTLRAHAIRNRALFNSELAHNRELLNAALDGLLRSSWARDEAKLRRFRDAFQIGPDDKWRKYLLDLASTYQPERRDILEPQPDPDDLSRAQIHLTAQFKNLQVAAREVENSGFPMAAHRQSFGVTKTGQDKLRTDAFNKVFKGLEESSALSPEERVESLSAFFKKNFKGNTKAGKDGFTAGLSKKASSEETWQNLANACQNFREAVLQLDVEKERQRLGIVVEAVKEIRQRFEWEKRRRGVLSYDDMISHLVKAVRENPGIAEKLRDRYKACIVDEFQDTDPLQWELLRRLCLEVSGRMPLFLVGDPKQAIYSFRGGDLQTYLEARNWMREKSREDAAQGFGLRENHRSHPRLIAALNKMFSHPEWFGLAQESTSGGRWHLPEDSGSIAFTPAEAAVSGAGAYSPVIVRDFNGFSTKVETQKAVHAWIASEIQKLSGYTFKDVAVLTRSNFEAQALEKYLRRRNIPCRVRQKGGLFQGPQADAMKLLLDLLEKAGDPKTQARILMLPYLRAGNQWPKNLPEEIPSLIQKWASLANAGQWTEFFHSLLFDSGYLYRLNAESQNGSEVQILQTLVRALTEEGLRGGLSLRGLRGCFDSLGESDEESSTTVDNGDENRITVMTLHMSKGLEFPIVFLDALNGSPNPPFYTLREPGGVFRHVLDKKSEAARLLHETQAREEDKRLFYVGMTRAKDLLFVPLPPTENTKGNYGPLADFAGRALRAASESLPELFSLRDDSLIEAEVSESSKFAAASSPEWPEIDPWEEAGAFFQNRRRRLSSYSQLLKYEAATAVEEDGRRVNRDEIDAEEALEEPVETVSALDLPPGANTGNALHELFETVDFAAMALMAGPEDCLQDLKLREKAKHILQGFGLAGEDVPAALKIVWNTLRMPLPDPAGGEEFQLANIADRKHEMEFLFPPNPGGFLWGFMDLIFRHEGRYYLLDWKSNLLDRYGPTDVQTDMDKHQYHLQYQLYSVALDKWLGVRLPDYDPAKHFGGIYYLYLRGASPKNFSGFVMRPGAKELREDYPARLRTALGLEVK